MYQAYQPPRSFSVFPPVIKNLLILNGLFFMAQFAASADPGGILGRILTAMALYAPGAPDVGFTIFGTRDMIPGFWPWQLISYGFLHGGFTHIFFNMFALWMFGAQLENAWGSRRFAIFYFSCVAGAALIHLAWIGLTVNFPYPVPTLGASGGVFGVLMGFGMMFPEQRIMLLFPPIPLKAKWFVIGYGALSLFFGVSGLQGGVAHFAHLGGMLFGFLLIMYWRGKLPVKPEQRMYW